jgi:integrase
LDEATQEQLASEFERFLTACQQVLADKTEKPQVVFLFIMLLVTGSRLSEFMLLRVDEVDLVKGTVTKEDHKGRGKKRGRPKVIKLNSLALAVLRYVLNHVTDHSQPWVFESHRRKGKPYNNISKPWARILEKAGIQDFTRHDMRHTFATLLLGSDVSLKLIQELLHHSDIKTTEGYAHTMEKKKNEASEVVGTLVAEFFKLPEPDEKIVQIATHRTKN